MPNTASAPLLHNVQRVKVLSAGIASLILMIGIARFAYTPMLPLMQQQADLGVAQGQWPGLLWHPRDMLQTVCRAGALREEHHQTSIEVLWHSRVIDGCIGHDIHQHLSKHIATQGQCSVG